jgi:sugar-specific transcriptional regulator TrmB
MSETAPADITPVLIASTLLKLGLEEQEAKTYVALLDLGEATATKLAERTGLGRVHMYQLTNRLIGKGLASSILKGGVKYFLAAEPEKLLQDLQEKEEELQKILPELKARQQFSKPETKAEVYRGREGINTILKLIIKDQKPYYILGGAQEACGIFKLENTIFVRRAETLNLPGKILARKKDEFFVGRNEEYRFVPDSLLSSTTQMIWGNKTALFVWSEPYYVLVIESEEVAKNNLATFDYLWDRAEMPSSEDLKLRGVVV